MKSAIYNGQVYHRRYGERQHALNYRIFYFLIDLDELEEIDTRSRVFGVNRGAWFSFRESDHGEGAGSLRKWCEDTLEQAGLRDTAHSLQILTTARILGYVFNPISVIYCKRADGSVGAVIYEVNNTFGERIAYVAPVSRDDGAIRQRCDKSLFVSPFYALEGHYDFRLSEPSETLELDIDYRVDDVRRLRAVFRGQRRPFERRQLAALAWRHPFGSVKVIAGIHYEALKLWFKGVPLVRHRKANTKLSIGTEL